MFVFTQRHIYIKVGLFLTVVLLFAGGCVRPANKEFNFDSPVMLRPAASGLRDKDISELLVPAKETLSDEVIKADTVRKVVDNVKASVVSVYVQTSSEYRLSVLPFGPFGGIPMKVPGIGLGSGFFVHESGYILTNNHVIEDAQQIGVLTSDEEAYAVRVVARDAAYDVALLKIQAPGDAEFQALKMGDSDLVGAGDMVLAVGNPLGLGHTVTMGIVSQTDRNLTGQIDEGGNGRHVKYIQTDAAINPGSSGGPIITITGSWVGLATAGITEAQGLGFVVPSSQVVEFIQNVLAGKGQFEKPK